MIRRGTFRLYLARIWVGVVGLGLNGGCTASEALVDGFYGGISDTVATLVSDVLLSQVDQE